MIVGWCEPDITTDWKHCAFVCSEESLSIQRGTLGSFHNRELFKAVEQFQSALK